MRKLIFLAVAGYLWKKFSQRADPAARGIRPVRR